jgi:hypothetical protein
MTGRIGLRPITLPRSDPDPWAPAVPQMSAAALASRPAWGTVGDFLVACCVDDPQGWVLASELSARYVAWSEQHGTRPLSPKSLAARLIERGYARSRLGPKQARSWSGLRLRNADDGLGPGAGEARAG